jgi:hypothetical protein
LKITPKKMNVLVFLVDSSHPMRLNSTLASSYVQRKKIAKHVVLLHVHAHAFSNEYSCSTNVEAKPVRLNFKLHRVVQL